MTSIVLAGGRSRRLGQDKRLVNIGGEALIDRVIGRLLPISSEVIVVVAQRQPIPAYEPPPGVRIVVDILPDQGALGGIYTGLTEATSHHGVVVACDMPFLNGGLLRHLMSLSDGYDVIVPWIGGRPEPLHAIYSKECLSPIRRLMKRTDLKIVDFWPEVRVRPVPEEEVDRFDPQHLSFFNINTAQDLARARELAAQEAQATSGPPKP